MKNIPVYRTPYGRHKLSKFLVIAVSANCSMWTINKLVLNRIREHTYKNGYNGGTLFGVDTV